MEHLLEAILDVLLWSWIYGDDDRPRWLRVIIVTLIIILIALVVWWFLRR